MGETRYGGTDTKRIPPLTGIPFGERGSSARQPRFRQSILMSSFRSVAFILIPSPEGASPEGDSIVGSLPEPILSPEDIIGPPAARPRPLSVGDVLRRLPPGATPSQQDSAVQANFQPGEIHYSGSPDTLHLPGHSAGSVIRSGELPKYYKESFFAGDSLYHPEILGGRYGIAGDPVPYTLRGDDMITLLLLGSFILAVISFAASRRFFFRQMKSLIYISGNKDDISETSTEIRFQAFFVTLTALLLSILYLLFIRQFITYAFAIDMQMLLATVFAIITAYFLAKGLLYFIVNMVFFDSGKNTRWMYAALFITTLEGMLLFPLVLLMTYFSLSMEMSVFYFAAVLLLVKIHFFYKAHIIFFQQKSSIVQNILYFCALEAAPLIALWSVLRLYCHSMFVNI